MNQRDNIDHLYGRVIGILVQHGRVLDRPSLLGIRAETQRAVSEATVLWCENLTNATAAQIVSVWQGKLPVHENPS